MPPSEPKDMWAVNVIGSTTLLAALAASNQTDIKVLSAGSASQYDSSQQMPISDDGAMVPRSYYGLTKLAQERAMTAVAETAGLNLFVARTFNLLGPGISDSLVPGTLCKQYSDPRTNEIEIGNTAPKRDFVDIRDAVAAYVEIVERGTPGESYNVCSGEAVSIKSLIQVFAEVSGRTLEIRTADTRARRKDIDCIFGSNGKIRAQLGWQQTFSLTQSVQDMLSSAR
jgi:GDP-4-dehydro-6-deoxy-D-mannose reductase